MVTFLFLSTFSYFQTQANFIAHIQILASLTSDGKDEFQVLNKAPLEEVGKAYLTPRSFQLFLHPAQKLFRTNGFIDIILSFKSESTAEGN